MILSRQHIINAETTKLWCMLFSRLFS